MPLDPVVKVILEQSPLSLDDMIAHGVGRGGT